MVGGENADMCRNASGALIREQHAAICTGRSERVSHQAPLAAEERDGDAVAAFGLLART